jgi:hypothetical protein
VNRIFGSWFQESKAPPDSVKVVLATSIRSALWRLSALVIIKNACLTLMKDHVMVVDLKATIAAKRGAPQFRHERSGRIEIGFHN